MASAFGSALRLLGPRRLSSLALPPLAAVPLPLPLPLPRLLLAAAPLSARRTPPRLHPPLAARATAVVRARRSFASPSAAAGEAPPPAAAAAAAELPPDPESAFAVLQHVHGSGAPAGATVFVGVGRAGNIALNTIRAGHPSAQAADPAVYFAGIHTDADASVRSTADSVLEIGFNEYKGGRGCLTSPTLGSVMAERAGPAILQMLGPSPQIVFVAAGLGGGTGTGAGPFVVREARKLGAHVIGIVTIPAKAAGSTRILTAHSGVVDFSNECNALVILDNELIWRRPEFIDRSVRLHELLRHGFFSLARFVNGGFEPGTLMSLKGLLCVGCGIADDPLLSVEDALFRHFNQPLPVQDATLALVHVEHAGGVDEKLLTQVVGVAREHLNRAEVVTTSGVDDSLGAATRVTFVLSGLAEE